MDEGVGTPHWEGDLISWSAGSVELRTEIRQACILANAVGYHAVLHVMDGSPSYPFMQAQLLPAPPTHLFDPLLPSLSSPLCFCCCIGTSNAEVVGIHKLNSALISTVLR